MRSAKVRFVLSIIIEGDRGAGCEGGEGRDSRGGSVAGGADSEGRLWMAGSEGMCEVVASRRVACDVDVRDVIDVFEGSAEFLGVDGAFVHMARFHTDLGCFSCACGAAAVTGLAIIAGVVDGDS